MTGSQRLRQEGQSHSYQGQRFLEQTKKPMIWQAQKRNACVQILSVDFFFARPFEVYINVTP